MWPPLLTITPDPASMNDEQTLQFTLTGTWPDGTTEDLTTLVFWDTTDPDIATVETGGHFGGLAMGLSPGSTQVRAVEIS